MSYLITYILLALLAFFSHKTTSQIFTVFYRIIRSEKIALWLVCLLYLPGTFLHESAHLLMALLLFLPVTGFTLVPKVIKQAEGYGVTLGSVRYIQRDPVRGFLVGIAPICAGILFFYFLPTVFDQWGSNLLMRVLLSYFAFTVASTMLSSKQDLRDAVYMIPLIIIGAIGCYIFNVDVLNSKFLLEFNRQMNYHLTIAVLINIGAYIGTKVLIRL